ncbi:hypothetical protein HanOQP8_Chr01g0006231 [Helianthus annuus]|nr:hypothetical protein HanOQP8_Chr01g0006231 [Helianthus annuus]
MQIELIVVSPYSSSIKASGGGEEPGLSSYVCWWSFSLPVVVLLFFFA